MMRTDKWLRPNIRRLKPYRSAREEHPAEQALFLDANENSLGSPGPEPLNRYPDPLQKKLKMELAQLKNVAPENIFLGNGSDEAIDLLIRAFCEPAAQRILITPPTYGMYRVCADINNVAVDEAPLNDDFSLNTERVRTALTPHTRLLFICSPNNPTANLMDEQAIRTLLDNMDGLVIIDEAYIDFAETQGWLPRLNDYENLVVLQTFSKAWGLAGARLGMAFAHPAVIDVLNRIKYPYNVNRLTQQAALEALRHYDCYQRMKSDLIRERHWLSEQLKVLPVMDQVWPSRANFILVRSTRARDIYHKLAARNILIRYRGDLPLCPGCLRITVGTHEENQRLIGALQSLTF